MNKVHCDTILDLIPLVKDNIASESSRILVEEHIKTCESCKKIYINEKSLDIEVNDIVITKKFKKQLIYIVCIIMLLGTILGMMITHSMNMFYNILIIPTIGGLSFLVLRKKSFIFPNILFVFTFIWQFVQLALTDGFKIYILQSAFFYACIYAFFCIIGVLIAWLLEYAFKKEDL